MNLAQLAGHTDHLPGRRDEVADSHNIAIFMEATNPFLHSRIFASAEMGAGRGCDEGELRYRSPNFPINSQQDQGENGAERSTAKCPLMLWERIAEDHFLGIYLSTLTLNTIVECQISIPYRMRGSTFAMRFVACLKHQAKLS